LNLNKTTLEKEHHLANHNCLGSMNLCGTVDGRKLASLEMYIRYICMTLQISVINGGFSISTGAGLSTVPTGRN